MIDRARLERYVTDCRRRFEDLLGQMVEIPSISMDPAKAPDIRRMADFARQVLTDLGAEAQIVETGGYPIVSGGWTTGTNHPTVTIYNHMDVQPAQEPEWTQAPFAFKNENGLYHGRGATDDKGPALSALFGARSAIEQGFPINIRFLWELEEEIGSPHFAAGLKNRTAIPRPDSVVVSDTIWLAKGKPAMPYGLRGLLGSRLTLRTGTKDAHSGVTGGAARNPLAELMEVAQACVDAKTGKVKIPGFYKDVIEPTKAEIKSFLASGFQVKSFKQAYGFQTLRTQDPAEIMRRIWAAPTFEVHGLTGGYHGPGVKTIVPGHGELKVSMRLVPNQTPEKAFALLKCLNTGEPLAMDVASVGNLAPRDDIREIAPYKDMPYLIKMEELLTSGRTFKAQVGIDKIQQAVGDATEQILLDKMDGNQAADYFATQATELLGPDAVESQ